MKEAGGDKHGIVYLQEKFVYKEPKDGDHVCLVFEPLGKNLYDFIKENGYKGFVLKQIQSFAFQTLKALKFLHEKKLTHTDLKPENILLLNDRYEKVRNKDGWPIQV
mmetsp:Transcript_12548/g.12342  ORF Transcript_12548/g.12342 Transcript_12548/m.12342 type:complete len:107 (+) Transcript_12548:1406-1726(+)